MLLYPQTGILRIAQEDRMSTVLLDSSKWSIVEEKIGQSTFLAVLAISCEIIKLHKLFNYLVATAISDAFGDAGLQVTFY
jgi:hypothetical protein